MFSLLAKYEKERTISGEENLLEKKKKKKHFFFFFFWLISLANPANYSKENEHQI